MQYASHTCDICDAALSNRRDGKCKYTSHRRRGEGLNGLVLFSISFRPGDNSRSAEPRKGPSSISPLAGSSRTSRPKMTPIPFACIILAALCEVQAISSPWRPIVPGHADGAGILHQEASIFENAPTQTLYDVDSPHHLLLPQDQDTCSLYKVSMSQQLYFEVSTPGNGDGFSHRKPGII